MSQVPTRPFGDTGLTVSALGLGAGGLGDPGLDDPAVDRLLGRAIDRGVRLIDTAPSYGDSEARIGRHLEGRRAQVVLSTKVGYGVPGVPDWTGPAVALGVDLALSRLATDYLDLVHLHSCPAEVLARGEVTDALQHAVQAGKVRVAAYSGDGHALYEAQRSGAFGAVQASLSLCDRNNAPTLALAAEAGLGVIVKRPLANAPWRFSARPDRPDEAAYWDRWTALGLELEAPGATAVRFAAYHPDVHTVLVGTRSVGHLEDAVDAVQRGPLPAEIGNLLDARWDAVGNNWPPCV